LRLFIWRTGLLHFSHLFMSNQLLAHFKQISSLTASSEAALASLIQTHFIPKNQDLQQIGQTCKTLYFLKKGLARIYYFQDGNDVTEGFYLPFCLIARAESLFAAMPSKKAIQVLEDAEVWSIATSDLFSIYETHRDIERLFSRMFEQAYVQTIQRIENLQFHTAEERYRLLTQDQPDVLRKAPLKYIASYLGITQVSLSRIRAKKS
jgi:CRP-like cAMP-binding protein